MILIVEDNPQNVDIYSDIVRSVQEEVGDDTPICTASTYEEALKYFSEESVQGGNAPELVIVDMEIPIRGYPDPRAGFKLINDLRDRFPHTRWIPITAHVQLSQIELEDGRRLLDALYAVSSWGIFFKDQISNLESMLRRFFNLRADRRESMQRDEEMKERRIPPHYRERFDGHVFVTRQWELYQEIRSVASNGRDVLLFGERGTGKRLVAHLIHHLSDRRDKRFEMVDGELESGDLQALLFPGIMDNVRGGTLYIRHLNRLSVETQRRLRHYRRYKDYDVRIIGGIGESRHVFRDYDAILGDFRDAMVPLDLPPLRERKDDIPVLVEVFLEQFNEEQEAKGGRTKELVDPPAIYELLQARDWREGNIAQLRQVVEEVLLKTSTEEVTSEDFMRVLAARRPQSSSREPEDEGWEPVARRAEKPTRVITEEDLKRLGL